MKEGNAALAVSWEAAGAAGELLVHHRMRAETMGDTRGVPGTAQALLHCLGDCGAPAAAPWPGTALPALLPRHGSTH